MKLNKLSALSLIVFILLFGCTIPGSLATQVPPTVNNTLSPSSVPASTVTPPTPAPVSSTPAKPRQSLHTSGPYLAYRDQSGSRSVLTLLDADGQGQSSTFFPANYDASANSLPLSNTLSPDGKWLAYYTGSAGTAFGAAGPDATDLTLNLMRVPDGTVQVVTPLLSKDYPDIFTKAAGQLSQPDLTADTLRNAFILGITQSLDWSPDGRYLAFAGQMDGLSSDLYLYDSETGSIKRLSSGPEEVQWISWSPDGKWILDGSSYSVGEGMQFNVYATLVDGATINQLSNGTPQIVTSSDWLDDTTYVDSNGANGPGSYDLKLVDVNTGKTSEIWQGSYSQYAYIPYGNWVVLNANTPTWPWAYTSTDFSTGIFLVNTTSLKQVRVNSLGPWGCCNPSQFFPLGHIPEHLFLVNDHDNQAIQYLTSEGKLIPAGVQADQISVSPDRLKWIAIAANLQVYSDDGSLIRTVDLPAGLDPQGIGPIIWRQDSSGLFFTYHDLIDQNTTLQLYFLELAKGNPVQVGTLSSSAPDNFIWVTGS
jgi:Tol biopolymer transport system component